MTAVAMTAETADEAAVAPGSPSDLSVMGVVPGAVAAVWPRILPMIETARASVPAMVADREWPEDIKAKAEDGFYVIWMIYDGAALAAVAVSSIDTYARAKCCTIQYLAGRDLGDWLGAWTDEISDWAKTAGCTQIEARGRLGWGRKLTPLGAEVAGAAYVMEIDRDG